MRRRLVVLACGLVLALPCSAVALLRPAPAVLAP